MYRGYKSCGVLKQKIAYCIDEFNDRVSVFIVAQSFTWLISRPLFRPSFATEPTANDYNSPLINIRERDCSFAVCFLYRFLHFPLFLSHSSLIPFPFLASVRPLAVFIAIIETHRLHPPLTFFFFRGFRQWAESLCLAGRVVNLATLLPPLRSDLAHLIPLAEGRERRG